MHATVVDGKPAELKTDVRTRFLRELGDWFHQRWDCAAKTSNFAAQRSPERMKGFGPLIGNDQIR
jgi:hypothetical protein